MDSIRIEISGNAEALQPTVDKLKEIGAVDKKNAEQFNKHNQEYLSASTKRFLALEREKKQLELLQKAKDKAFSAENIKGFEKSIQQSTEKIRLLSGETKAMGKSMEQVVTNTNAFASGVKKSYGFLRIAANIIPGLGISGIILAGWEVLVNIIEKIAEDFTKLDTLQTNFNTAGLQGTNEFTTAMKKFREEIELLVIQQNILKGTQTELDLKNKQLLNTYGEDVLKIKLSTIEKKKILMDAMSELDKERNRVLEENRQKGLTGLMLGNGEDYDKAKALFDQKTIELGKSFTKLGDQQKKLEEAALKKLIEGRNLLAKQDEDKRKKLVHDISIQDLENKKKESESWAKIDSIRAKEEASDKLELDRTLFDIEGNKNAQILKLDIQIARKRKDQDILVAKKTITDAIDLENKLYNIKLAYKDKLSALNNTYNVNLRVAEAQFQEQILADLDKMSEENAKEVEKDNKQRIKDVKDNEQRLADVLQLENETNYTNEKITKKEHDQQDIKDQLAVLELKKENLDRYSHEYIDIEIKEQELKRQLREDEKAEMKKSTKEAIDNMQEIGEFVIKLNEERIKNNIEAIDHQQEMQKDAIDVQRKQAELGHANTLAFEEKKQADLEKERMKEQKKLVKLKELEMFMNAIAAFSKDDPKSAVAKALAELAIVKGVEATFAEDGGLLGQTKDKSWQGRKHKGGGDILVHAQTGEGILSRADISSMGGEKAFLNFKNMLGTNKLPQIPMSGVMFQGMDTRKLEDKLDNLEKAFKNKKEVYVDWESHGVMNVTTMENGIKDTVKHILKKPRI
jgi:hypothetical protein